MFLYFFHVYIFSFVFCFKMVVCTSLHFHCSHSFQDAFIPRLISQLFAILLTGFEVLGIRRCWNLLKWFLGSFCSEQRISKDKHSSRKVLLNVSKETDLAGWVCFKYKPEKKYTLQCGGGQSMQEGTQWEKVSVDGPFCITLSSHQV